MAGEFSLDLGPCTGCCAPAPPPPIQTNCCPNTIPQTLHVTFSGGLSISFVLTWDGVSAWLNTAAVMCGAGQSRIALSCVFFGGSWQWLLQVASIVGQINECTLNAGGSTPASTAVCSPLSLHWNSILTGDNGTCCAGLTLSAVVTT